MSDDDKQTRTELLDEVRALRQRADELAAARERLAFLTEASAALTDTLDYEERLRRVARLAVPRIADWCAVDLATADGGLRRLAIEHVDPARLARAAELRQRYPADPAAPGGVFEVLRTGRPLLYSEVTDAILAAGARDAAHLDMLRSLGVASLIVVPLAARGRSLGAISLAAAESGRRFGPEDLALAEDFARRAATVIDNARLYAEMRASRDEIDAILRDMDGGIIVQDSSGRMTYANDAAARLCGFESGRALLDAPLDEVLGRFVILDEAGATFPLDLLPGRLALRGQEAPPTVLRLRMATGEERWTIVRASAIAGAGGAVAGAISSFQEVTALKRAEVALQQQREWLAITLSSIGDAVIATDGQGRVAFMNPVAETLTGWPESQARGRRLAEVFRIADEQTRQDVEDPVARVLREGAIVGLANHTILLSRDGAERPIDDSAAPIRDAGGDVIGVVLIFRDITERRQVERRLSAQYAVAHALSEAETLQEAAPGILEAIGASLGWDWGALWSVDQAAGVLRCLATWHAPAIEAARLERYTLPLRLGRGEGIPGRAWASGRPHWSADAIADARLQHTTLAAEAGLRAMLAVPIRLGGAVLGAIELYSRAARSPDDDTLALLMAIGSQIGQFAERKRGEEILARYQLLSEQARDIILFIRPDGQIVEANQAALAAYGYTRGELLGRSIQDLRAVETRLSIAEQMARADGEGLLFETLHRRGDGRSFPVEVSSRGAIIGGERILVSIIRDITERKQAEGRQRFLSEASKLLAGSLDYEATLQNIAGLAVPAVADWCAVHMLESDGTIRRLAVAHVDPAKAALASVRPDRYALDGGGQHIVPQVVRDGQAELVAEVNEAMLAASARDEEHLRLLRALGMRSYMCVPLRLRGRTLGAITLVASESGRVYGAEDLALAEELAHRAALAVDNAGLYRQAQNAIRLRDQFLSIAAHELKTPLTSLFGQAQLLQRRMQRADGLDERYLRNIGVVVAQAERLNRMVVALLDIARIEQGQLSIERAPLDICALARRVVSELQPTLVAHRVECAADGALLVEGDELRLEQVLQNLLQNAVKYSPGGGTIHVRVERRGQRAAVVVADGGIGIPAAARERLFQRFYRASNASERQISGMGVGLYVVKEIVTLHGGEITVESDEGQGSTFTIWLPLSA